MRKGLVVTLGVALVLSVAQGYAEAPLIGCIPDIIVTDADQGAQTADTNLFIFSNALDLDEYVTDRDTSDSVIRWSFIESTPASIEINGIGSNTSGNVTEPGAFDIRAAGAADGLITVENVLWSGTTGTTATMDSMISLIASDGTSTRSQSITITTVNNGAAGTAQDALVPAVFKSYTFDAGDEGWVWTDYAGVYPVPSHSATGGGLQMTETVPTTPNVTYGGWESPKNPATGVQPKVGCILRARYRITSTASAPAKTPSFRLRCSIRHMVADAAAPGGWRPQFDNPDFLDDYYMYYGTVDFKSSIFANRVPGAAGQTYAALVFPQQVADTLLSTSTVAFFAADLLDLYAFDTDAGTLVVDSVIIDGIDRPELGAGDAVTTLSFTSFDAANWNTGKTELPGLGVTPNVGGVVPSVTGGALSIAVGPGSAAFETYVELKAANGARLTPGQYYRLAWTLTSTETGSGDAGPLVRAGLESTELVFSVEKQLDGGSLLARLSSTPQLYEMWVEAPAGVGTTGLTEVMVPRFSSWLVTGNVYPFFRNVSGTIRATGLQTEVFSPSYWE